ncbi:MAG: sigma-70 family RNA polymerase sigma factor [Sphingopyxis sp.]|nr:sigma-70 family RNA polymerase sigma factor [Sphingopyxis sp.]
MENNYLIRSRWLATHVLPHEPSVRAWLHRTTPMSDADIDDVVQESYAVLAKLERVDSIRDPRNYLFQVAKSVFLQNLRRSQVVRIESVADMAELQIVDDAPSPEKHALGLRELRRVEAAIESMPTQVRRVVWLRRVEGLSQRETAEEMGLAEHTIEKHMARGIKYLLSQFGRGGKVPIGSSRTRDLEIVEAEQPNADTEARNGN